MKNLWVLGVIVIFLICLTAFNVYYLYSNGCWFIVTPICLVSITLFMLVVYDGKWKEQMTNKRKIKILEGVIRRFNKIISKFNENKLAYKKLNGKGICDNILLNEPLASEDFFRRLRFSECSLIEYIENEFLITMPRNKDVYKWELTKEGYQARVRACEKAIIKLKK